MSTPRERFIERTEKHINNVRFILWWLRRELDERGKDHDASKLQEPELSGYASTQDEFATTTYGTPEYAALLKKIEPTIQHHYSVSPHHPEHHSNGIAGMTLIDLVEMWADWQSMADAKGQSLTETLQLNVERFKIDPQLASILENTARAYDARTANAA